MSVINPPSKKRRGNMNEQSVKEMNQDQPEHCNLSPDMFEDCSPEIVPEAAGGCEENEGEDKDLAAECMQENLEGHNESCWRGVSLAELQGGPGFWGHSQRAPIRPSSTHTVLFKVPGGVSQPLSRQDTWDSDHVRLPCSHQNLYPVTGNDDTVSLRSRWELVKEALQRSITSSLQLETAILSYNSKYIKRWDFAALHYFFSEILEPPEVNCFFTTLLPSVIRLALQLPELVQAPIPLLKQHQNHSLSLSQLQIASLLANALLCTFPRRNTAKRFSEYASFPDINFNRLFQLYKNKVSPRTTEKLKCLFHYFRRVCQKAPQGAVTFTRSYLPPKSCPQWDRSTCTLKKLHITSEGTIENQGQGMLQVDFANRFVGGGVLARGCVQEEIRFIICPELIISRLFTECLDSTEALHITGCERFSDYNGYSDSFEWGGDHQDKTPRDSSGRMLCSMVGIDALAFRNPHLQYTPQNLIRELNKAYVGFYNNEIQANQLSAVATGNWGCGVYRGNPKLKALLQLMAATQAGRNLAYFTFGDQTLRDDVFHMYTFLTENHITVCQLWRLFCQYCDQGFRNGKMVMDLYPFMYESLQSKSEPSQGPSLFRASESTSQSLEKFKKKERERIPKVLKTHESKDDDEVIRMASTCLSLQKKPSFEDRNQLSYTADKRLSAGSSFEKKLPINTVTDKQHFPIPCVDKKQFTSYNADKKLMTSPGLERKSLTNSSADTKLISASVERKLLTSSGADKKFVTSPSVEKKLHISSTKEEKLPSNSSCRDKRLTEKEVGTCSSMEKLSNSNTVEKVQSNDSVENPLVGNSRVASSSEQEKGNLVQWLEHCDRKRTSPVPKRKISDYFSQVTLQK